MTESEDITFTVHVVVNDGQIEIIDYNPRVLIKEKENQNGGSYRRGSYYKPSKQFRRLTRKLKKSYKNKNRFYK